MNPTDFASPPSIRNSLRIFRSIVLFENQANNKNKRKSCIRSDLDGTRAFDASTDSIFSRQELSAYYWTNKTWHVPQLRI